MKQTIIIPHIKVGYPKPPTPSKGWIINDTWACYNDPVCKGWTVVHRDTMCWVTFADKKEHCAIIAEELDGTGIDWSDLSTFSAGRYRAALDRAADRAALLDAQKALDRAKRKALDGTLQGH